MRLYDETCLALCEGQYIDIATSESDELMSVEGYLDMIGRKTAALIAGSIEAGALLATDDEAVITRYRRFGWALGLAFQINDDLLGIWGAEQATGKEPSDVAHKKKTLPVIYAVEHAGPEDRARLLELYSKPEPTAAELTEIVAILERVGARDYTRDQARRYRDEALAELDAAGVVEPAARARLAGDHRRGDLGLRSPRSSDVAEREAAHRVRVRCVGHTDDPLGPTRHDDICRHAMTASGSGGPIGLVTLTPIGSQLQVLASGSSKCPRTRYRPATGFGGGGPPPASSAVTARHAERAPRRCRTPSAGPASSARRVRPSRTSSVQRTGPSSVSVASPKHFSAARLPIDLSVSTSTARSSDEQTAADGRVKKSPLRTKRSTTTIACPRRPGSGDADGSRALDVPNQSAVTTRLAPLAVRLVVRDALAVPGRARPAPSRPAGRRSSRPSASGRPPSPGRRASARRRCGGR